MKASRLARRRAQLAYILKCLLSPIFLLAIACLLPLFSHAVDDEANTIWIKFPITRNLSIEDSWPFIGKRPWNDTYQYDPKLNFEAERLSHLPPYNSTLNYNDKHWSMSTEHDHLELRFTTSRCVKPVDVDVSGFYGPGSYIAWLITVASTMLRHEMREYMYVPDETALDISRLKQIRQIDSEMIAVVAYALVSIGDLTFRITTHDYSPATSAAITVVFITTQVSWLSARPSRNSGSAHWRTNPRSAAWFVIACLASIPLCVMASGLLGPGFGNERLSVQISQMSMSFFFTGGAISSWALVSVHVATSISAVWSFRLSFKAGRKIDTILAILGLIDDLLRVSFFVLMFFAAGAILWTVRQSLNSMECNRSWMQSLLPTSSAKLSDLDQAAVLGATIAAVAWSSILYTHGKLKAWQRTRASDIAGQATSEIGAQDRTHHSTTPNISVAVQDQHNEITARRALLEDTVQAWDDGAIGLLEVAPGRFDPNQLALRVEEVVDPFTLQQHREESHSLCERTEHPGDRGIPRKRANTWSA